MAIPQWNLYRKKDLRPEDLTPIKPKARIKYSRAVLALSMRIFARRDISRFLSLPLAISIQLEAEFFKQLILKFIP
jgi:hypothetical protein